MSQDLPVPLPEPRYYIDGCIVMQQEAIEQWGRACMAPLQERVRELEETVEHTRYWYAVRYERLFQWAHEELDEAQRNRYFNIVANGTADVREPPTYAQQFNGMKHRLESAEAELSRLKAQEPVAELRADMKGGGYVHWLSDKVFDIGTKLYAAPPSQEQT